MVPITTVEGCARNLLALEVCVLFKCKTYSIILLSRYLFILLLSIFFAFSFKILSKCKGGYILISYALLASSSSSSLLLSHSTKLASQQLRVS